VLGRVAKRTPFVHVVTPHSLRHTFSIRNLNAGVDIKMVSRWLGHLNSSVIEDHYSHAVRSTLLASENAYDESLRRQRVQLDTVSTVML
jgi:integrase